MTIRRLVFVRTAAFSLILTALLQNVPAAEQFPYQAIVVGEQVEVRCGPGNQFYVTSMAKANDSVTVHRHDHGGWYMISPPPGSFSWIDAGLVNPIGGNRGLVTLSPGGETNRRALVRIGSQLGDDHSFFGRELSNGDEVTILGEKILSGRSGGVRMLKIVPPAQEFRWIKGEYLVPMSQQIQQQIALDPYQVPAEHRQRQALLMPSEPDSVAQVEFREPEPVLAPARETKSQTPVPEKKTAALTVPSENPEFEPIVSASPSIEQKRQDFARLAELDQAYAGQIARDPSEWNLEPISKGYLDLQKSADAHVAHLVSLRLDEVLKRQEIARHYRNFVQISTETSQRDAQLLAQRPDFESEKLQAPQVFMEPVPGQINDPLGSSEIANASSPSGNIPLPEAPAGVTPQLNGAGIIQPIQAPPGFPRFILTAPDGRMLSYVEPGAGVSLEPWIGKPCGLIGHRSREENYGADVIRAQKIVPVRLAQ